MPYIKKEDRERLDEHIENSVKALKGKQFHETLGDINYMFSRIIAQVMGEVSYSKIAMATGVLENIKQELYRRSGEPYEDKKIKENGDIPEYKE